MTATQKEIDYLAALTRLVDAVEEYASGEPDMPSHAHTIVRLDTAIDTARELIAQAEIIRL